MMFIDVQILFRVALPIKWNILTICKTVSRKQMPGSQMIWSFSVLDSYKKHLYSVRAEDPALKDT